MGEAAEKHTHRQTDNRKEGIGKEDWEETDRQTERKGREDNTRRQTERKKTETDKQKED